MRLLKLGDDGNVSLTKDFITDIPPYAILSHTWGDDEDEVTFADMVREVRMEKRGWRKILFCGEQARSHGLEYFWVDTCCIDKSNSTELSEAINSMFRWYQNAVKCYVYLADVPIRGPPPESEPVSSTLDSSLSRSRWFTRGWTLQELIAPASVDFFTSEGERIGDKTSLEPQLRRITRITVQALRGSRLSNFSVRERMSWSNSRTTKREEDMAYSLLGIFGVHMPLIYGEGKQNAFRRLNEEIRRSSSDHETPTSHINDRPDTDLVATIMTPFLPGKHGYNAVDEGHLRESASLVFQHLDHTGRGHLTRDELKNFCTDLLIRSNIDIQDNTILDSIISDRSHDPGGSVDETEFISRVRSLIGTAEDILSRQLRVRLYGFRQKIRRELPKNEVRPSWGWDKIISSGEIVYCDNITGQKVAECYPAAHWNSFSMMAKQALQCVDKFDAMQDRLVAFSSRESLARHVEVFDSLRELALRFIIAGDSTQGYHLNGLDSIIVNSFLVRALADRADVPSFFSEIKPQVESLQFLGRQAAETLTDLLALLECLREIRTLVESRSLSQRHELFDQLWQAEDIIGLSKQVLRGAPDWKELNTTAKEILGSPHVPTLMQAAEDITYNYALRTPLNVKIKSVLLNKNIVPKYSVFGRFNKAKSPVVVKVAFKNCLGKDSNLEIEKKWEERQRIETDLSRVELPLDLDVWLQQTSEIYMKLSDDERVFDEVLIHATEGFHFLLRNKMADVFKLTRGTFVLRCSMTDDARQIPDWRPVLGSCSVFNGDQDYYAGLSLRWEERLDDTGRPYYVNHREQTSQWTRPVIEGNFSRGPITAATMPIGWARQWDVEGSARSMEAPPPPVSTWTGKAKNHVYQ